MNGSVSTALLESVRLEAQRKGIIVWLDKDGDYLAFVDELQARFAEGSFNVPVAAFRGSFLELMTALEAQASGLDMAPLIIHMPGFNEESIRQTPVFELYSAGHRFRRALPTLITETAAGLVAPDEIEKFVTATDPLTLEAADAWLEQRAEEVEGGVRAHLEHRRPEMLLDDLLTDHGVVALMESPADWDLLWEHLHRQTGLDAAFRAWARTAEETLHAKAAYALAGFSLCVEYVHDLKRPPEDPHLKPLASLPTPLVASCRALAEHLRRHRPADYERYADEFEARLRGELEGGTAAELGKVDTFRHEESRVYHAALSALQAGSWQEALSWARERTADQSFWVRQDQTRSSAWQLVGAAAELGATLGEVGRLLQGARSLDEATARYAEKGWRVDTAHRELEQRRAALLDPRLPCFGDLRGALDHLRLCLRAWADELATDFSGLCETYGYLPDESLQQRHLFEQTVRPLVGDGGAVAVFLVDALRYEMGEALRREIGDESGTTVDLKARLAELPTVTPVGMNALAGVVWRGKLHPLIKNQRFGGFATQEFQVDGPDSQRRMMQHRVGGRTCPHLSLSQVLERDATSLRRAIAEASLLVVHSGDIDQGGEAGLGPSTFARTLRDLRAAWSLLRDAGVQRFVFTGDHGFLLLDETTGRAVPFGRKCDPSRRHALYPAAVKQPDQTTVSLAALGYEAEGFLLFPRTTAVFDTGKHPRTFVHGGSSLQERVIPVLTVSHRRKAGGGTLCYRVEARPGQGLMGMHCVVARVFLEEGQSGLLSLGGPAEVELGLRAVDRPEVAVELCDVRGEGSLRGGTIRAMVEKEIELFFRLRGTSESRALVELFHPTAALELKPGRVAHLFTVEAVPAVIEEKWPARAAREPAAIDGVAWLEEITHEPTRRVFAHLHEHGSVTESEATRILGGPRQFRQFSLGWSKHRGALPFAVRVESTPSGKRYVREGAEE